MDNKERRQNNKPLVIMLSVLCVIIFVLAAVVIYLFINNNSAEQTTEEPDIESCILSGVETVTECIDLDEAISLYREHGIDALDKYFSYFLEAAGDQAEYASVLISELIFLVSVNAPEDDFMGLLNSIDMNAASNLNKYRLYLSLSSYYANNSDAEEAEYYYNAAMSVEGVDELKRGKGYEDT